MGNKVSADAVNIPPPVQNGNPPPECPMHNKAEKTLNTDAQPSECPVQHDNSINPYNMVSFKNNVDR